MNSVPSGPAAGSGDQIYVRNVRTSHLFFVVIVHLEKRLLLLHETNFH